MKKSIDDYIEKNKNRFLDELFDLLKIQSISSDSTKKNEMQEAAEMWKKILLDAGADKAVVMPTKGNPVTYGEKIIGPKLPTILVYAHMDVMPVDPIELWHTSPFEPVIKDGKIWGRGADDDKGQGFMSAKAFEIMMKTNSLPCNVKFLIEGEEEIGSPSLPEFCEKNKELLKADIILVSDTSMIDSETPTITTGLRGLAYWEIEVTGPNADLHSGLFGGAVANPINVLCKMIADTTDEHGKITIPDFYSKVEEVSQEERDLINKAPFNIDDYKKDLDVKELHGEKGYTTYERVGIRPSFDVCGIHGGYTGEGAKTVLPSKAVAKISTRLVPGQDHEEVATLVIEYFKKIAPDYVKVDIKSLHGGPSYVCPINLTAYKAASKALYDIYGKEAIPVRSGGSIPIISSFESILGIKSILLGFGLKTDAIHSPNENFPLEQFFNGIRTIPLFFKHFAEMKK